MRPVYWSSRVPRWTCGSFGPPQLDFGYAARRVAVEDELRPIQFRKEPVGADRHEQALELAILGSELCEREIVNAIFAAGDRASAEDIRARLTDPPSYSAVRAMLARLEEKGYVRHREEGLRYVYSPTTRRTAARRAALQQLVEVFFGGSPGEAATALIKQGEWSDEELDALRAEIDRVRAERRK